MRGLVRSRWSSRPRLRRFVGALLWSFAIEACLLALHDSPVISYLEEVSLDWAIRMHAGVRPPRTIPFALIDLDDSTYRAWGEPVILPREKLLSLIRYSLERGAAQVIVDVETSLPGGVAGDRALVQYLQNRTVGVTRRADASGAPMIPPVILVRGFRRSATDPRVLQPKMSILDPILQTSPSSYLAAPLFELDADSRIRRWRLWEPTCGSPYGDVLPSIQLVSAALWHPRPDAVSSLHSFLQEAGNLACRHTLGRGNPPAPRQTAIGNLQLSLDPSALQARIFFSFAWDSRAGAPLSPAVSLDGRAAPLVTRVAAHRIEQDPDGISREAVEGRIVVIGGSFYEARDVYGTPVGPMPGALVIVNAIHSLLAYGELNLPPLRIKLPLAVGIMLLTSAIAAYLRSFAALCVAVVAVVAVLLFVSFYLFPSGVWLELSTPLLGLLLHHVVAELLDLRRHE